MNNIPSPEEVKNSVTIVDSNTVKSIEEVNCCEAIIDKALYSHPMQTLYQQALMKSKIKSTELKTVMFQVVGWTIFGLFISLVVIILFLHASLIYGWFGAEPEATRQAISELKGFFTYVGTTAFGSVSRGKILIKQNED